MRAFILFAVGLVFGLGLYLSGMTQPSKVQGFLDIAGRWDPSLSFVMGGALAIGFLAFFVVKRRSRTFLGDELQLPPIGKIDKPLVVGSLIFGVGWGLAGVCPGPALFNVGLFDFASVVFIVSMTIGMALERACRNLPTLKPTGQTPAGTPPVIGDV